MLIIKGKISLNQYFIAMLISTLLILGVVAGAFFLEHDKNTVAVLMFILSVISLGSSAKIMHITLNNRDPR